MNQNNYHDGSNIQSTAGGKAGNQQESCCNRKSGENAGQGDRCSQGCQEQQDFPFAVPDYRFDQRNEMFKRRTWDPEFLPHGNRLYGEVKYQDRPGYRKLDYALRNASWNMEFGFGYGNMRSDSGLYSWSDVSPKVKRFIETDGPVEYSPKDFSHIVKKAARFYGADLVGVCSANPNLVYSHQYDLVAKEHKKLELPENCTNVIVMAIAMDYEESTYSPDGIAGAATGLGYSMQAVVANLLAAFIRGLGYTAVPSGNDTAISVPLAMAAGLGEISRMGLLVTQEYGPRVRICKVFTDLPLERDTYQPFGVERFCHTCKKCARHCPAQAIPDGEMTEEGPSMSNHSGIKRWYVNPEKCFMFWVKNWMDCNNCVKVCPFNKPPGYIHRIARYFIRKLPLFNPILLWFDDALGYGKFQKESEKNYWDVTHNSTQE